MNVLWWIEDEVKPAPTLKDFIEVWKRDLKDRD